jgi:hypothetical protein
VNPSLAALIIVTGFGVAGWTAAPALRNRWLDRSHLVGLALLQALLLVQAGIAVARLVGGGRPAEYGTFVGYLITSVIILPLAVLLAFLERTRWGSVVITVAGLVAAVVTLRLQQVWRG